MNQIASSIGMTNSSFCNPHGLVNKHNYSTCFDLSHLLRHAYLNHACFLSVISTSDYKCNVIKDGVEEEVSWKNTHKCFEDVRFVGGKTGVTISAGPRLASIFRLGAELKPVVIVILNSKIRFHTSIFCAGTVY